MIPRRWTLENLVGAIREPRKFLEEADRLRSSFHRTVHNVYYTYTQWDGGFYVTDEDWDNLIILDGCRADLFESVADLNEFDSYERRQSIESNTESWSLETFRGEEFGDIVYVTANVVPSKTSPNSFHRLIEVWNDEDAYDENVYTVPKEDVIRYAR